MDNTKRFSNRVDDYVKYRPGYPKEVIQYLQHIYAITPDHIVADIGAGTGISSQLFLDAGHTLFGVEPNKEMREKSIELLAGYSSFHAIDGTAENTNLRPNSIDVIVAGQAFHWFDQVKTRVEFRRILKPGGMVVLLWNERKTESDFEKKYDQLIIKYSKDYVKIDHRNIHEADIARFFSPSAMQATSFPNHQVIDFNGLKGRLDSSSYIPVSEEHGYTDLMKELKELFNAYHHNGTVRINYIVKVYVGNFSNETDPV